MFLSCKSKKSKDLFTLNSLTTNYDTLSKLVKTKGDTNAYEEIFYFYVESPNNERIDSILYYSKIMASDFNYYRAYYDYLSILCEKGKIENNWNRLSELNLTKVNAESKDEIISWLNYMLINNVITQKDFDSVIK